MDYTHSHHFIIARLSHAVQLSPVHKLYYTFLKTATIPTYYGISIAIPSYIAMHFHHIVDLIIHFHHIESYYVIGIEL